MFHSCRNQVVGFYSKMFEIHLWKSDILSKDAGRWPKLNTLTILAKVSSGMPDWIQNVFSAGRYNTIFKIQVDISLKM